MTSTPVRWKAWRPSTIVLRDAGIVLHLSEVKGPVMDRLTGTEFLAQLRGQVFLTHFQALQQVLGSDDARSGAASGQAL